MPSPQAQPEGQTASAAFAKYEDATLRKVLVVTLDGGAVAAASPPNVFLEALAQVWQAGHSLNSSRIRAGQDSVAVALHTHLAALPAAGAAAVLAAVCAFHRRRSLPTV